MMSNGVGLESSSGRVWPPGLIFDTSGLGCDTVRLFLCHMLILCVVLDRGSDQSLQEAESRMIGKPTKLRRFSVQSIMHLSSGIQLPGAILSLGQQCMCVNGYGFFFLQVFFIPKKPAWSYKTQLSLKMKGTQPIKYKIVYQCF